MSLEHTTISKSMAFGVVQAKKSKERLKSVNALMSTHFIAFKIAYVGFPVHYFAYLACNSHMWTLQHAGS